MQNNNRDCRPITNARGVGGGTCIYNSICTRGVGDGRGNNLCYTPQPKVNKIDTFTSTERRGGVSDGGMNVTVIVNVVLIILILMVLYKVYNPSTSYF
jgi:hypothetical protein